MNVNSSKKNKDDHTMKSYVSDEDTESMELDEYNTNEIKRNEIEMFEI